MRKGVCTPGCGHIARLVEQKNVNVAVVLWERDIHFIHLKTFKVSICYAKRREHVHHLLRKT